MSLTPNLDFSPACSIRTLASIPHIPVLNLKLDFSIPVTRQAAHLKWNTPSDQGSKIWYGKNLFFLFFDNRMQNEQ